MSKRFYVTVYQSLVYEVIADEADCEKWGEDPDSAYAYICENGIEPADFGTDEVTIQEVKDENHALDN